MAIRAPRHCTSFSDVARQIGVVAGALRDAISAYDEGEPCGAPRDFDLTVAQVRREHFDAVLQAFGRRGKAFALKSVFPVSPRGVILSGAPSLEFPGAQSKDLGLPGKHAFGLHGFWRWISRYETCCMGITQ